MAKRPLRDILNKSSSFVDNLNNRKKIRVAKLSLKNNTFKIINIFFLKLNSVWFFSCFKSYLSCLCWCVLQLKWYCQNTDSFGYKRKLRAQQETHTWQPQTRSRGFCGQICQQQWQQHLWQRPKTGKFFTFLSFLKLNDYYKEHLS